MQHAEFAAHAKLEERHWWFTARREILRHLLHTVAPAHDSPALLDIGCGTGGNIAAFANEYRAMGLDPSADAIAFARARYPGVSFVQTSDPEQGRAHLADGGAVLLTDVLEHVEDDRSLLAQAINVLPRGGHLVLTVPADPALWSRHDTDFGHFRRYRLDDFRALWRDAPVRQRLLSPFNARLYPMIAMIRRIAPNTGNNLHVPAGPLNRLLHGIFAGEARALVTAIDRDVPPFHRGVSLVAVLRKQ
jgi:SAM-dependent methyltransferase